MLHLSRLIRSLGVPCALAVAVLAAACAGPRTQPTGSFLTTALGVNANSGEAEAERLMLFAAFMNTRGGTSALEDTVRSLDTAAAIYARHGNLAGASGARRLQADSLNRLGRTPEAEAVLGQAEQAAQAGRCAKCLAEVHVARGQMAMAGGRPAAGMRDLDIAATIHESNADYALAAATRLTASAAALQLGDTSTATIMATDAGRLGKQAGNTKLVAQAERQQAEIDLRQGRTEPGVEHLDRAQASFGKSGARLEQVDTLTRLARVANGTGAGSEGARRWLAIGDAVTRSEPDAGTRARQWLLLAEEWQRLGDTDAADARFAEASAIYRSAGLPAGLALVEVFRIVLALDRRDYDEIERRASVARRHLAEKPTPRSGTVPLALPMPQWRIEANLDLADGVTHARRGRYREALVSLDRSVELSTRWADPSLVALAQGTRGSVLAYLSRFAEAEAALTTALGLFKRLGRTEEARETEQKLTLVRRRAPAGY